MKNRTRETPAGSNSAEINTFSLTFFFPILHVLTLFIYSIIIPKGSEAE